MARKYLKSLVTDVVLPYSEAAMKSADIRLMEPAECEAYEVQMGVAPKPAVVKKKAKKTVKKTAKKTTSDDADGLLAALKVD